MRNLESLKTSGNKSTKKAGVGFIFTALFLLVFSASYADKNETRLLQQPDMHAGVLAFVYGGDIWVANIDGTEVKRITSTPAVESNPHFSPDGKTIAFTSNRNGGNAVYTVSVEGGQATRLTWYPGSCLVRGWTNDGNSILYATNRESAPTSFNRLWLVPAEGGPSVMLSKQWAFDGSYSADGKKIAIDRVSRWDVEWRNYRGGQNTPLIILDLESYEETLIPNDKTFDKSPVWLGHKIYFLSDRDWISNVWAYSVETGELEQITHFKETDVKSLTGYGNQLVVEQDGYFHLVNLDNGKSQKLSFELKGDFPWADPKWVDLSSRVQNVSLSPSGKRAVMQARGEIFTVPVEHGSSRNISMHEAADRKPIWSPDGKNIAWFSDRSGKGYDLYLRSQDAMDEVKKIAIGISKMAWEPAWSPDGKYLAFVDDDVRIRIVDIEEEKIETIDNGGNNLERGGLGITWSKDSKWLAYAKSGSNNFRQIKVWSVEDGQVRSITNPFADAFSPAWDRDGKHLYFLASTNLALGSGWANTSSIVADPSYSPYIINLRKDDPSPFELRSDEEEVKEEKNDKKAEAGKDKKSEKGEKEKKDLKKDEGIAIDFDGIDRRIMALPMSSSNYATIIAGPEGSAFIAERPPKQYALTLHKFTLKDRKATEFMKGASQATLSADGKKLLVRSGRSWKLINAAGPSGKGGKTISMQIQLKIEPQKEWNQVFEEAWRHEQEYFYADNMHGRDWDKVYKRYAPLIPYVKHRADLTYIIDQLNGELSVGHSFVGGGDYPSTASSKVGLLGANLRVENNVWKIDRIFTTEDWNPGLSSPLEQPGLKVKEGDYIVGINGIEISGKENIYKSLDGSLGVQTILHISKSGKFEDSWKVTVKPIRSESALRQRAWVEDNRRMVDKLSDGKLAYVWVPNTGGGGFVSFNRYFFAQQDKLGAVIDERFNGGGNLDDYMVDLMSRSLRAALTNEVPNGKPMQLPAGILGPKVLLINEMAGSGGDFFPWVFRHQKIGPLIGSTTWGGLVKSSRHFAMVDGSYLTAPDNAVFDPEKNEWVAENAGVAPDIAVRQDAKSLEQGIDPQLERAVKEALKMLEKNMMKEITPPPFPTPAKKK